MHQSHALNSESAASRMVAVCLLLTLTILFSCILFTGIRDIFQEYGTGIQGNSGDVSNYHALVRIDEIRGGLASGNAPIRFRDNFIILKHEGGDHIPIDALSVVFKGTGNSFYGIPGTEGNKLLTGEIEIRYENLSPSGKNKEYENRNAAVLSDGKWSPGESIILNGNDSVTAGNTSSIAVSVNDQTETSDNYGLKSGTECEYRIIVSMNGKSKILAEGKTTVKKQR